MLSPRSIVYSGIFLTEDSRKILLEKIRPLYENIFAHHVTVKYRPNSEEIFNFQPGKEYELEIVGVASDGKSQAAVIKGFKTESEVTHVTISTLGETKPNYSKDLLKSAKIENLKPFKIKGKYGFFCDGPYFFEFPTFNISTVQIPTRPQPDTIIALFLLNEYASSIFQGIDSAEIKCNPIFPKDETFESLLQKGILTIDFEQSIFDHHNKDFSTASESVAEWCNIRKNKEIQKLLEFAKRSEEGKGTISSDAIDKMFGLDGLIMALNRVHFADPKEVFRIVEPILAGHLRDITEKLINTPVVWAELLTNGKGKIIKCHTNIGNSKIAFAESDSQNLPGFLRSYQGERCDLFVQKLSSGHINILSKANNNLDLSKLAGIIRQAEALIQKRPINSADLRQAGRLPEIPEWYYDKITNSILNGGRNVGDVKPTSISWGSFEALIKKSFE
ncbi:MAG TPA: hypothetical protein VFA52_03575 [Candidatus Paceibacterota bacterium]|nr:hypothetical protein [Candidatus Paceibacterota bacterium]